jgi:hypothetical protein
MADVLGCTISALLGEHHRIDERHHYFTVDARDPQRQLIVSPDTARRTESLHGIELLRRADVQLSQDLIDDDAETKIASTGLFEPGQKGWGLSKTT